MTGANDAAPRVLVVGAYERDNFGDLLFWLVTSAYLEGAELHATAPFAADMTELLDRKVEAYGPLLRDQRFDVIWTAGGQVGRMDLRTAFRLSAPPEVYAQYQKLPADKRARMLRELVGGGRIVSPYIPSPLSYDLNAGAITVLNSVGLDGISAVEPNRRAELIALLHGSDFVSVRDEPSSDLMAQLGVEHRLVPDAVHAVSRLRPRSREPEPNTVIVQASSAHLQKYGHREFATAIAKSPRLVEAKLRFVLAGTASGHDSVADYEQVIAHLTELAPRVDVDIASERRPYDLVDRIAGAGLVIATSLHVRIVACAYDVPRVSLARPKPTKYARTWDPEMPYGVAFDELDAAVEKALELGVDPDVRARSARLSDLVDQNLRDLADRVLTMAREETDADRERRARARRRDRAAFVAHHGVVASRDAKIAELNKELDRVRRELAEVRASRSYRLARGVGRVRSAFLPKGSLSKRLLPKGSRSTGSQSKVRSLVASRRD